MPIQAQAIAATAPTHGLTVVTLNGRDFEAAGVEPIREVPRADFAHGEHIPRAYVDEPLRIGHGQVTTEPSLVALMVDALALRGTERMLEVGAGYG
jgi:protein-L-isoaspartate(D-aspartate) O-methyltransferase